MGPNRTYENLYKESPSIPAVREIHASLEKEFNTLTRGRKHTTPDAERDINRLMDSYTESQIYQYRAGRMVKSGADWFQDIVAKGAGNIAREDVIHRWSDKRSFVRARGKEYNETAGETQPQ